MRDGACRRAARLLEHRVVIPRPVQQRQLVVDGVGVIAGEDEPAEPEASETPLRGRVSLERRIGISGGERTVRIEERPGQDGVPHGRSAGQDCKH